MYPCCVGGFGMFVAVMYRRRLLSSVFAIIERMDIGLYEVPSSMSLFGFGWGRCHPTSIWVVLC